MACLEDYPIIETAINYGLNAWGKPEAMAKQIAGFWLDGWLEANKNKVSEEDAKIMRRGVDNWIWL